MSQARFMRKSIAVPGVSHAPRRRALARLLAHPRLLGGLGAGLGLVNLCVAGLDRRSIDRVPPLAVTSSGLGRLKYSAPTRANKSPIGAVSPRSSRPFSPQWSRRQSLLPRLYRFAKSAGSWLSPRLPILWATSKGEGGHILRGTKRHIRGREKKKSQVFGTF